ncbi:UPAR/Ly6 domain-containing protein qvr-like [Haliotis asinina]|uniref:UPAR/Ly6 domain-containing protein qvr-like n=1 Tax=Haliotis asinina TaxID=109174 RepID=UPI0035326464
MDLQVYGIATRALLTVWLMTFLSAASKNTECHSDNDVIDCFYCTTVSPSHDDYCGDPFNTSHPQLTKVPCKGYCAKWVTELASGAVHYTRTCSKEINMKMHKHLVCMKERGSRFGHLCFCDQTDCNAAVPAGTSGSWATTLTLTALQFFLMNIFPT